MYWHILQPAFSIYNYFSWINKCKPFFFLLTFYSLKQVSSIVAKWIEFPYLFEQPKNTEFAFYDELSYLDPNFLSSHMDSAYFSTRLYYGASKSYKIILECDQYEQTRNFHRFRPGYSQFYPKMLLQWKRPNK